MGALWLEIPATLARGSDELEELIRYINDSGKRLAQGAGGGGTTTNNFTSSNTTITSGSGGPWYTLAYGATLTVDKANGLSQKVTLTGDADLADPVGFADGDELTLRIIQDGTGGRTVTRTTPAKWELPSGYTLYGLAGRVITLTYKFDVSGNALLKSLLEI